MSITSKKLRTKKRKALYTAFVASNVNKPFSEWAKSLDVLPLTDNEVAKLTDPDVAKALAEILKS